MNIKDVKKVLYICAKYDIPLTFMLWGKNGIGKTDSALQVHEMLNEDAKKDNSQRWNKHVLHAVTADRTDISGLLDKKEVTLSSGQKILVQTPVYPEYIHKCFEGRMILILDEFNRGSKDVMNSLFEPINQKSIHGIPFGKQVLIVLIGNPDDSRFNVKGVDVSLVDRATHILVQSSPDDFLEYGKETVMNGDTRFHKDILGFISEYPDKLDQFDERDSKLPVTIQKSPRGWGSRVNAILRLESIKGADAISPYIIEELLDGTIPQEDATQFSEWRKKGDMPIRLESILNWHENIRKRVERYSTGISDGVEGEFAKIELGLLDSACEEIIDPKNNDLVKEHCEKVLTFLEIIPSSLQLKTVQRLVALNNSQSFWEKKIMEVLVDENGNPIKNPDGNPKRKWDKLIQKQAEGAKAQKLAQELYSKKLEEEAKAKASKSVDKKE